jgi:Lrp/AsnC family leucine-responsive transcriptional regulator
MKFGNGEDPGLDATDVAILQTLQQDCKSPLARIGELVGLSAPSVSERIEKLEQSGVIRGYSAVLGSRELGLDVTAFIGVVVETPGGLSAFEETVVWIEGVLECHHVTGHHTLLLKVKAPTTEGLENLISRIRSLAGVVRTETTVVLSTHTERSQLPIGEHVTRRDGGSRRRNGRSPNSPRKLPARKTAQERQERQNHEN